MRISYEWLKDYLEITKTPSELADDLSNFGFQVESMEKIDSDTVLDLEVNPNRGDCLSILGIAREMAALYRLPLKNYSKNAVLDEQKLDKTIEPEVSDPKICPRITLRIIDNIKIGPSPAWLQQRLKSYGFRPINNIVDITNYTMIAIGQPLHAFDLVKIKNGRMNIRLSKKDEKLTTLDGKNRVLPPEAIIIEDDEKIYDLAGIMGGANSEVSDKTKTIVLQGAIFDSVLIRRTSKYLSLATDASYRYERGVDFKGTIDGVNLAAKLIKETSPLAKIGPIIDRKFQELPPTLIMLDSAKINKLLGTNLLASQIRESLELLGFQHLAFNEMSVPSYRSYDVKIWQDLAEEIARVYGYEKIEENAWLKEKRPPENKQWQKREIVKDKLRVLGLTELDSFAFIDKEKLQLLGFDPDNCLEIDNPLSAETQYLRPTLVFSLLAHLAKNPWAPEIVSFEIGKVFQKGQEFWQVGLVAIGKSAALLQKASAEIGGQEEIVNIEQKILDIYKIRRPVKLVVVDFEKIDIQPVLIENQFSVVLYRKISKFPPTVRDLAFVAEKNIIAENIRREILKISPKILLVEIFDEFASEKFGPNKKNLAFHLWLQDLEGPILSEEVEKIIQEIISLIEDKFGAKLRS